MRVLVTGAAGMLARDLVRTLSDREHEVIALSRRDLDVRDGSAVIQLVRSERPGCVVQCAAYTAVDKAEVERDLAFQVNEEGTRNVSLACGEVGALFVYPSTDYVFSGSETSPYLPTSEIDPLNVYGASKAAGETAARLTPRSLVVRTSWLYGEGGANFVDTMLRLADERERVEVVDDQVGRPTWTRTLSLAITRLVERGVTGTHHVTDGGAATSWYGFADVIFSRLGRGERLVPVGSAAFPRPAPRPAFSVLELVPTENALGYRLPDWRESLNRYLTERGVPEIATGKPSSVPIRA